MHRLLTLVAKKDLTLFNRAAQTIQVQLEANSVWELDATELASQQRWKLQHDSVGQIFNNLTWTNGVVWSYNTPIDRNKISTEDSRSSNILEVWIGTGLALWWTSTTPPSAREQ
eukprot:s345_g3.t1